MRLQLRAQFWEIKKKAPGVGWTTHGTSRCVAVPSKAYGGQPSCFAALAAAHCCTAALACSGKCCSAPGAATALDFLKRAHAAQAAG